MKMNRKIVKRFKLEEDLDDGYVHAEAHELVSMVWEITKDSWSFIRGQDVERRLQRDVATLIRRAS